MKITIRKYEKITTSELFFIRLFVVGRDTFSTNWYEDMDFFEQKFMDKLLTYVIRLLIFLMFFMVFIPIHILFTNPVVSPTSVVLDKTWGFIARMEEHIYLWFIYLIIYHLFFEHARRLMIEYIEKNKKNR